MMNCFLSKSATLVALAIILLFTSSSAQDGFNFKNYGPKGKVEPQLIYQSHYASLLNRQASFVGGGLGLRWESGFGFQITYQTLTSRVFTRRYSQGANWRTQVGFLSFGMSQLFYRYSRFQTSLLLENNFGSLAFSQNEKQRGRYGWYSFEPALYAEYQLLQWLWVSGILGYRMAFTGGEPRGIDFSSFKVNVGFGLSPLALYKAYKNKALLE